VRNPKYIHIHEFDDSGDAYDTSQCSDEIEMGDVLVIKSEKVVGFLLSAWPCAVTVEHGKLHAFSTPTPDLTDDDCGSGKERDWSPFFEKAKQVALELGFPLFDGTNRVSKAETAVEPQEVEENYDYKEGWGQPADY
jgi:hypothetical protein